MIRLTVLKGLSDMSNTFNVFRCENISEGKLSKPQFRKESSSKSGRLNSEFSGNEIELLSNVNFLNPVSPAKDSGSRTPDKALSAKLMDMSFGNFSPSSDCKRTTKYLDYVKW